MAFTKDPIATTVKRVGSRATEHRASEQLFLSAVTKFRAHELLRNKGRYGYGGASYAAEVADYCRQYGSYYPDYCRRHGYYVSGGGDPSIGGYGGQPYAPLSFLSNVFDLGLGWGVGLNVLGLPVCLNLIVNPKVYLKKAQLF